MKKLIAIISLVSLILITLTSCTGKIEPKNPGKPANIPGPNTSAFDTSSDVFRTIAENDNLVLMYNDLTTDIKVKVKSTGYEWSTEYFDGDSAFRGEVFDLDYYSSNGSVTNMSSLEAVEKGQFRATDLENGIKVQYGLGFVNFKSKFPPAISEKRAEMFFEKMTDEDRAIFNEFFMKIDFEDAAIKASNEENKKVLRQRHPLAVNEPWYYPRITFSDENRITLNQMFERIGYTDEDLKIDVKGTNFVEKVRPEFNVSIEYQLNNNSLEIKIPEKEIYHSKDFIIETIRLHKNVSDFNPGTKGYYLLPDGSGSIMNFDNGKDEIRGDALYIPIYGIDKAKGIQEKTAYFNDAIFPILGTCVKTTTVGADQKPVTMKNGMLAIIEEGDAFAGIEAHSGDGELTHNNAWIEFRINEKSRMKAFTKSNNSGEHHSVHQFQRYLGDIKVSYNFLTGENAEYSGMAQLYRSYLYGDQKGEGTKDYLATVEMVGAINGYGNFLGVSYNKKEALTTFSQVEDIAKDLKKNGVNNLNIKLTGWFNGGYEHGYSKKIKVESLLGGKDELEGLITSLKEAGINLFPDADIQFVYAAEGTPKRDDISLLLNRRTGIAFNYGPATFKPQFGLSKYILTMPGFNDNLNGFMKSYEKFDIKNVSFRSIGQEIPANYKEKGFMERQETLNNLVKSIEGVNKKGYKIMGNVGHAPFVKHLDIINNMPIESAGHDKADYSIPFTSMVLSGYVDYTYKPINLGNGERKDLLKLIESGSGANFTITGQKYDKIHQTSSEYLYATVYDDIKGKVLEAYKYLAEAQKNTYGQRIVKHERLSDEVYKTTFENGYYTIVNYGDNPYTIGNVKVEKQDYYTGKGGDSVAS